MNYPVFDLHCDTVYEILGRNYAAGKELRKNSLHVDLERAKTLPGYAQCFACFTTPTRDLPGRMTIEDVFERELAVLLRELNSNQDLIRQAFTADDVEENLKQGIMSAIFSIEGPAGFGYDPALLENLYQIGFRITTLGWNEQNALTGSHITGGGLTDLGREYVREAQRLGMIVDVSHISDAGFWDIMDMTQAPVIASHSNSRHVCNVSRNLTDDMFREICATGGVAGFNMWTEFVGGNRDLDSACAHFLHFLEIDPSGKHIALGGDMDGCDTLPVGIEGIQDYPKLVTALNSHGIDKEILRNIFWNNALGVMRQCCI